MDVCRGIFYRDWGHVRFDQYDDTHPDFPDGQRVVVMTANHYRGLLAELEKLHAEVEGGPEPLQLEKKPDYEEDV